MDTEDNFFGGHDDYELDDLVEGREAEAEDRDEEEDDERPRGEDEAEEVPVRKKKDDAAKDDENKKKREPRPKLDAVRLAGPRGLLALEEEMQGVQLKGRGHELQDLDLLLSRLQHWAHRLFPSYTFDDCLDKLEKLGNKKNVGIQVKKIRLGLVSVDDTHDRTIRGEDYIEDEEDDRPAPRLATVNRDAEFDNVMATARVVPVPPAPAPQQQAAPSNPQAPALTEEQLERIRRNRLAAEERRLQRLKEQQEMELRAQEEAMALANMDWAGD